MDFEALNQAIANQDWTVVAGGGVAIVLGIIVTVLKMSGKNVPILDQALSLVKGLVNILPRKPAPPAEPSKQSGVKGVLTVVEEKKEEKK